MIFIIATFLVKMWKNFQNWVLALMPHFDYRGKVHLSRIFRICLLLYLKKT